MNLPQANVESVCRAYMRVPADKRDGMLVRALLELVIRDAKTLEGPGPVCPLMLDR